MIRPEPRATIVAAEHLAAAQRAGEVRVEDARASPPRPSRASARAWSMPAAQTQDVDLAERRRGTPSRSALERRPCRRRRTAMRSVRRPRASISAATSSTSACAPAGRDDVGAGVGKAERERAADAARAADDDGHASGKIEQAHRQASSCCGLKSRRPWWASSLVGQL